VGADVVLACEHSLEGALAATGVAYLAHLSPASMRLADADDVQPRLGEVVVDVPPDGTLARRVWAGFVRTCCNGDEQAAHQLVYASASSDPAMPEAIHRYLRLAFSAGPGVFLMRSHPAVVDMLDLARSVSNECEKTRQFVRFSELMDGSFLALFSPGANTIPLVGGYFAARMREDRFCLIDTTRRVAAVHQPGWKSCSYLLLAPGDPLPTSPALARDERYVRAMWKRFYDAMALPGRDREARGYDLRASLMPKRFWGGLTELDPANDWSFSPDGQVTSTHSLTPET